MGVVANTLYCSTAAHQKYGGAPDELHSLFDAQARGDIREALSDLGLLVEAPNPCGSEYEAVVALQRGTTVTV